jgi:RES domain-containing protein
MSSSIWTQCEGRSRLRPLAGEPWRVVESQHRFSTRKLVDSDLEQQVLEELIDAGKPPAEGRKGLHFLLYTPFRYPPLPHGSRFGRRGERGIWYGSEDQRTLFAEAAYYKLLFLEGTTADLTPLMAELSAFGASYRTERGIDLLRPPFDAHHSAIASPSQYGAAQRLGQDMREAGVEVFRYPSARDAGGGVNVGLFTPRAFTARRPSVPETWGCVATREAVEFMKTDVFRRPRSRRATSRSTPVPVSPRRAQAPWRDRPPAYGSWIR